MASIGDVAARAGVSVATVSRALRGLANVAPSTRQRVLAAAEELDYIADPNASRLAAGHTRSIGMVVPFLSQWYFTQCVSGAEAVFASVGYDLLLYNVSGAAARQRFVENMPFRKRVDGIVAIDLPLTDEELAGLADADIPVVTVGIRRERFSSVAIDNVAAATAATRHLVNLGHTEIGLISSLPDDPAHFAVPTERREGYRRVLKEHALEVHPELEAPGNFSLEGGAEAMAQLLSAEHPPTAVFAQSDEMAIGAMKTVRDAGLTVGEDISLIGFDDHEVSRYVGLTTIAQPVIEQGEVAASTLLEHISTGAEEPRHIVMPTNLTVRGTTGPRRDAATRAGSAKPLAARPPAHEDESSPTASQ